MKTLELKKESEYLDSPYAKKAETGQAPCLRCAPIRGASEKGSVPHYRER